MSTFDSSRRRYWVTYVQHVPYIVDRIAKATGAYLEVVDVRLGGSDAMIVLQGRDTETEKDIKALFSANGLFLKTDLDTDETTVSLQSALVL